MAKTQTGQSNISNIAFAHYVSESKTKAATKHANAKTSKAGMSFICIHSSPYSPNLDKEDKPKRAPSAYNLFVRAHMKEWKDSHPGAPVKEAMAEVRNTSAYMLLHFIRYCSRSQQCGEMHLTTQTVARKRSPGRQRRHPHLKLRARRRR